jgi:hypothetical protein
MTTLPQASHRVQSDLPFPDPPDPPYTPSAEDDASRLGYELVMDGEDPQPPAGWEFRRLVAFYDGVLSAWAKLEGDGDDGFEAWLTGLPDPS